MPKLFVYILYKRLNKMNQEWRDKVKVFIFKYLFATKKPFGVANFSAENKWPDLN